MDKLQRFRNFDTIRLVAAASVIFSHAFLIAEGHEKNEPFVRATGSATLNRASWLEIPALPVSRVDDQSGRTVKMRERTCGRSALYRAANAAALNTEAPTAPPTNWQPLVANDLAFASSEHEVGDATAMPRS